MSLSKGEVKRLIARYDADDDGYMDYAAFVDFMEGHHKKYERIKPVADKLRKMIKRKSHKRGGMRDAFEHFDRDANGVVDRKEFARGLDKLGFDLSSSEVRKLQECFDADGDGRISYLEFVDFAHTGGDDDDRGERGRERGRHGDGDRVDRRKIRRTADDLRRMVRQRARTSSGRNDWKRPYRHFARQALRREKRHCVCPHTLPFYLRRVLIFLFPTALCTAFLMAGPRPRRQHHAARVQARARGPRLRIDGARAQGFDGDARHG